jgi:hypothetical protein
MVFSLDALLPALDHSSFMFGPSSHVLLVTALACMQIDSSVGVDGRVTTALRWKAAGQAYLLSEACFGGLTLREKVFVMQQINLFVANLCDGGENGGDNTLLAPLLCLRH